MKDKITVIITIRNREAWRIKDQVTSIRNAGAFPSFHIVDYGSDEEFSKQYKDLCQNLDLQYTHMYSEGLPWNKCRAINYGVRTAQTPFIVTSDVDMLYEGNPFQWCLDHYSDKCMYHIETYWLPKDCNKQKSQYAGHGNSGGFQFIAKSAFDELGGYDERMVYWGFEDLDFPERLKKCGYSQIWLPELYKLYHVWHSKSETVGSRPSSATFNTLCFYLENKFQPILKQDWGQPLTKDDRPILKKIKENNSLDGRLAKKISIPTFELLKSENIKLLINTLSNNTMVELEIQSRLLEKKLSRYRQTAKFFILPLCHLFGLNCTEEVNTNYDAIYALIPIMLSNNLLDYYVYSDLSKIYLLRNTTN